ncbi:phosphoglycerate mutase family protein [Candidatus Pacearchaeota archaeon]|nr:phosphoglycerate mutase family protein [Candidatus Pacearchaeota archaeon]
MPLKIYLFRHGQSTYNRDKRFTGWNDAKLTKLGIKQAKIIAKQLKTKKIDVAFQTHLSRSKDTLKEVLKFHPECLLIIEDDRMLERNYGNLNGHSHSTIIKKYGQEKFDLWHRGFNSPPPKGESFAMVEKRVKPFIKDLIKFMKSENINVAISAHGNSIRLFRKIMEKASVSETVKWTIPYDKYFVYDIK